jgi:hypothetical protein
MGARGTVDLHEVARRETLDAGGPQSVKTFPPTWIPGARCAKFIGNRNGTHRWPLAPGS